MMRRQYLPFNAPQTSWEPPLPPPIPLMPPPQPFLFLPPFISSQTSSLSSVIPSILIPTFQPLTQQTQSISTSLGSDLLNVGVQYAADCIPTSNVNGITHYNVNQIDPVSGVGSLITAGLQSITQNLAQNNPAVNQDAFSLATTVGDLGGGIALAGATGLILGALLCPPGAAVMALSAGLMFIGQAVEMYGIGLQYKSINWSEVYISTLYLLSEANQSLTPIVNNLVPRLLSAIGFPANFDVSGFVDVIRATGLVDSWNSLHPDNQITNLEGHGEIGGVAVKVGLIKGMENSPDQVFFNDNIFCLQLSNGQLPFSNGELKQILRELAIGIFVHNTFPFFSLHFNNKGVLYPVIHPAYENTLVGEVIGYLDYFMKGFLNGGIYKKEFLNTWHHKQERNRSYLRSQLVDLRAYCKTNNLPISYTSLREKMSLFGFDDKKEEQKENEQQNEEFHLDHTKYRSSFRIIAEQKRILKQGNMFLIDPDFDVKYTIDLMPDYREYLKNYRLLHGTYPKDYQEIQNLYAAVAHEIKINMPNLPFCRDYFQMLGVISFFSYYFETLKKTGKAPILPPAHVVRPSTLPKAFPPIPVRHYRFYPYNITFKQVFDVLCKKNKQVLNEYLREMLNDPMTSFPSRLHDKIKGMFKKLLRKIPPPENEQDCDQEIPSRKSKFKELMCKLKKQKYQFQESQELKETQPPENMLEMFRDDKESLSAMKRIIINKFCSILYVLINNVVKKIYDNELKGIQNPSFNINDFLNELRQKIRSPLLDNISIDVNLSIDEQIKLLRNIIERRYQQESEILHRSDLEGLANLINDKYNIFVNLYRYYLTNNAFTRMEMGNFAELSLSEKILKLRDDIKRRHKECLSFLDQDFNYDINEFEKISRQEREQYMVMRNDKERELDRQIDDVDRMVEDKKRERDREIERCKQENIRQEISKLESMIMIYHNRGSYQYGSHDDLIKELTDRIKREVGDHWDKERREAYQRVESAKWDARSQKRKILEERDKKFEQYKNDRRTKLTDIFNKARKDLEEIKNKKESLYQVDQLSDQLIYLDQVSSGNNESSGSLLDYTLLDQLRHSTLDIADSGYYKDAGENFRIIGGCGVSLKDMSTQPISLGIQLESAVLPALYQGTSETFYSASHEDKAYAVFKLPITDIFCTSQFDYAFLLDSLSTEKRMITEKEIKVFQHELANSILSSVSEQNESAAKSKLSEFRQEFAKTLVDGVAPLKKEKFTCWPFYKKEGFNPKRKDKAGRTPVHYAAECNGVMLKKMSKDKKSNLLQTDNYGHLPIHVAACNGSIDGILYCARKNP